ncbi:MAG: toll/interleukin-1 receptor domain-containing protein [Actinomycetota bacterium]
MPDDTKPNVNLNVGGNASGQFVIGDENQLEQTQVVPPADTSQHTRADAVRASTIFVSHAHADSTLAAQLVELLQHGAGVTPAEIFCSSLSANGIPAGERWLDVLADELDGCELVVLVITEAYLESTFCMCELGALWIKRIPNVPLAVAPVAPGGLTGILGQTQVLPIADHDSLDRLGERAAAAAGGGELAEAAWRHHRDRFAGWLSPGGS